MTSLRLGHLIKGLGRGGAESLLPQTIRAGSPEFVHHVAYGLPWKDALVEELRPLVATVECFAAPSSLAVLTRVGWVREWIRRHQLDVVHCHLPLTGAIGRLGAWRSGTPIVYTEHNLQERYRYPTRWLNKATWRLQHRVVAVSDEVRLSIHREMGSRVPVEVVRNGIEPVAVDSARVARLREELDIPAGAPVIGTVAVFRTQKRLDHWLKAAHAIRRAIPEARFVLVGDGPERDAAVDLTGCLGLAEAVIFPGLHEDVSPYLGLFDVFMVSSEFEGLPLAVLEAMSAGLVVVATEAGGIPEVIEDGRTGYLVPVGAVGELAHKVIESLRGANASAMGAAAQAHCQEAFGIQQMVEGLERIYARAVAGTG